MPDETSGFRDSARSVRADARQNLSKIREERALARAATGPRWVGARTRPAPEPARPTAAESGRRWVPTRGLKPAASAPETRRRTSGEAPPVDAPARSQVASPQRTNPVASRITAAVADVTQDRRKQPASKPRAASPAPASARAAAARTRRAPTPLDLVPLIGPGLRWRLTQLGIDSVENLLATDEKKLAESLGEIGTLLNLPSWLAAARKVVTPEKKK